MKRDQNTKETTLKKFRSGWLRLSTDAGSYLITSFLDRILINTDTVNASYHSILYDSMKIAEVTAVIHRTAAAVILEFPHAKGMGIPFIVGDGISSQKIALSDADGS
jgi:hypothetical protein